MLLELSLAETAVYPPKVVTYLASKDLNETIRRAVTVNAQSANCVMQRVTYLFEVMWPVNAV
jgi:hypothetical protein